MLGWWHGQHRGPVQPAEALSPWGTSPDPRSVCRRWRCGPRPSPRPGGLGPSRGSVLDLLRPTDFARPVHAELFTVIRDEVVRGRPHDTASIAAVALPQGGGAHHRGLRPGPSPTPPAGPLSSPVITPSTSPAGTPFATPRPRSHPGRRGTPHRRPVCAETTTSTACCCSRSPSPTTSSPGYTSSSPKDTPQEKPPAASSASTAGFAAPAPWATTWAPHCPRFPRTLCTSSSTPHPSDGAITFVLDT